MKGCNCGNTELVQAALLALERLVPPRDAVKARPSLEAVKASQSLKIVHGAILETRALTKSIIDYSVLKQAYDGTMLFACSSVPVCQRLTCLTLEFGWLSKA